MSSYMISIDLISVEKSGQGRICSHPSSPKHWVLAGEFEIQRGDPAQMRSMGSSNGAVPWQEVRDTSINMICVSN